MKDVADATFTFEGSEGQSVLGIPHKNPDGSLGGWVAVNATIDPTAFVEIGAIVEPLAVVRPGQKVTKGECIQGPGF